MRRTLIVGMVLGLMAPLAAAPAVAGDSAAFTYRSETNTATAQFGDGPRGARVYVTEAVRDDATHNSFWVRVEVYNYDDFVWCNGVTDASGVNSYYFRQNGAHVDADIEVWCSGASQTVHVEAAWNASGAPSVNVVTTSGYDEVLGQNVTHVYRHVGPNVTGATLDLDTDLIGDIPGYTYGSVSMTNQHGVLPHGQETP